MWTSQKKTREGQLTWMGNSNRGEVANIQSQDRNIHCESPTRALGSDAAPGYSSNSKKKLNFTIGFHCKMTKILDIDFGSPVRKPAGYMA